MTDYNSKIKRVLCTEEEIAAAQRRPVMEERRKNGWWQSRTVSRQCGCAAMCILCPVIWAVGVWSGSCVSCSRRWIVRIDC